MQIADAIMDEAGKRGMRVLLAYHGVECPTDRNPLLRSVDESEHQWISDVQFITSHYRAQQKVVMGVDLADMANHRPFQSGGDSAPDWNPVVERAAAAILAMNPELVDWCAACWPESPCLDASAPSPMTT